MRSVGVYKILFIIFELSETTILIFGYSNLTFVNKVKKILGKMLIPLKREAVKKFNLVEIYITFDKIKQQAFRTRLDR